MTSQPSSQKLAGLAIVLLTPKEAATYITIVAGFVRHVSGPLLI
jgi:hypothetical protein